MATHIEPKIPDFITNRAHRGAFKRGWLAYELQTPSPYNPYHVQSSDRFGNSYRRVFARCWNDGWAAAVRTHHGAS